MALKQNHVQILQMVFLEFLSPKLAIFWGETVWICKKHEETTNLLGKKFLNFKRWGNEYCQHAWRPWRQAKSCSIGDRPPTHYFNTGHRPGFWFLDPHFSTHKPPALALALALILFFTNEQTYVGHKIRCSHGIWKSTGNGEWKFIISILLALGYCVENPYRV